MGQENIGSVSKVIIRTRLHNFVQKKLGQSEAFANVLPLRRRIETFNDYLSLVMQEGEQKVLGSIPVVYNLIHKNLPFYF